MYRHGWLTIGMLAAGCSVDATRSADGSQFGEEDTPCAVVDRVELALDEVTELGFSAAELLALAEGEHASTLTWTETGEATGVTVQVTYDGGAAERVDYEIVQSGTGEEPAIEIACADTVEVPVTFAVHTDDGQLAEEWAAPLVGVVAGQTTAQADLAAPQGSFDPWQHVADDSGYDYLSAWLELRFDAQGSSGTVHAQGEGGDRSDPDGAVYANHLELGSWP